MRRVADLGHGWHGAFAVGDRMTAGLGHLRDAGVSHVVLASRGRNLADLTATYERFAADVLPRL